MIAGEALRGILRADGLRLMRDRFLVGTAVYIITLSVALRWALPWVTEEVATRLAFDLVPYQPRIVCHMVVVLAALTGGFVGGFLLLEGRESGTVRAQLVSPVPLAVHVGIVGVTVALTSAALTVIEASIIGLALPPFPALVAIAVGAAPAAPILALFIATMASDKVEAFAYTKICGVAVLIPIGSSFVAEPWQLIAGVYPQYWAAKAYWLAVEGDQRWPIFLAAGVLVSGLWLVAFGRQFLRVARR